MAEQPASDFDGAWKRALELYLAPFCEIFFPHVYQAIDWQKPAAFLESELQQIAPEDQAGKQRVDKLVRVVRSDGNPIWVFIHIEIQSQRDSSFAERMLRYHTRIFDRIRQPVVSLAVLGDEEPGWHPVEYGYAVWGCELALRFPTVKLLELNQTILEATRNPFATLVLLHRDAQLTRRNPRERLERKVARYRALLRQGYQPEDVRVLLQLMEHLLRLSSELAHEARDALRKVEREELGMETFVTSFEELGRVEGRFEERRELVVRQLARKVGPLPGDVQQRVASLHPDQLLTLSEALLEFSSLAELTAWLDQVAPTHSS